jgi:plasmid stability protein
MSKMIQLRNVPDELHRRLKVCAASEGLSLSDFLIREVRIVAERPTRQEFKRRLEARPVVHLKVSPTQIIREERDRRSR